MKSLLTPHRIILGAFIAILAIAIYFFKERTIFLDLAFHIFEIIRTEAFAIQNYRFGSIFTQALPLLVIKSGGSLESVLVAYSCSFVLYYLLLYVICARLLKRPQYGLLLFLMLIFTVVHTFYWTQSEFPQGIAFLITSLAYIDTISTFKVRSYQAVIIVVLTCFIAFFHPSLIFLVTFFTGLKLLFDKNDTPIKRSKWTFMLGAYVFILVIKGLFFRTLYDRWALSGLKNLYFRFPDYINLQSNADFIQYVVKDYFLLIPALLIVVWFFVKRKHYKKLLFIVAYLGGNLFLTNVCFADGTDQFYLENLYLPIAFFLLVPLVFEIEHSLIRPDWKPILIAGIAIICLGNIFTGHTKYTNRLVWLDNILDKTANLPNSKLHIAESEVPIDTVMISWASPYEFWLLSTLKTGETRSIIIYPEPEELGWALNDSKGFLTNWGLFPYSELPAQYFVFHDTTTTYKIETIAVAE